MAKSFHILELVATIFALVGFGAMAASKDFSYKVPVYKGPIHYPDFAGAQRPFRTFRTAIRDGMKSGVNFAGRLAVVKIGCGHGCGFAYAVNLSDGVIYKFPQFGTDDNYLSIGVHPDSTLANISWEEDNYCISQSFIWNGTTLIPLLLIKRPLSPGQYKAACLIISPGYL